MKKLAKGFLMIYGFIRLLRRIPEILDTIKHFCWIALEFAVGADPLEKYRHRVYPSGRDYVNYAAGWSKPSNY